jgi:hypothetical protein
MDYGRYALFARRIILCDMLGGNIELVFNSNIMYPPDILLQMLDYNTKLLNSFLTVEFMAEQETMQPNKENYYARLLSLRSFAL